MRLLDLSFASPAKNLALDEILLEMVEAGKGSEVLRFWESPSPVVVLGVAQVLRQHVYERTCLDDGVRIARRCSAGGCVLVGPGCLNYTLVLTHEHHPAIRTLRGSYCYILERLSEALSHRGVPAHHKGVSDIAVRGKKVSGSAQKRRKHSILHHGTLLYDVDREAMGRYLREPSERPQYRGSRTHQGFVATLPLTLEELKSAVCEAFEVDPEPGRATRPELRQTEQLAKEKYNALAWTYRR